MIQQCLHIITECMHLCNCEKLHSNCCSLDYISKSLTCETWLDECLQFGVEGAIVTIATLEPVAREFV